MICNAGVAPFVRMDWFVFAKQFVLKFFDSVTYPTFNYETPGIVSDDGLGWVWQSNVFGHYVLVSRTYLVNDTWSDMRNTSVVSSSPSFLRLRAKPSVPLV